MIRADSCGRGGYTWLNNELIAVGDNLELSTDVTCMQTSTKQYKCRVESEFNLIIDMYEGHLAVQAWTNNCGSAEGLFGPCGGDGAINDFLSSSGSSLNPDTELNVTNIYEIFAASWQPNVGDSMFTDVLPNSIPSSAEMCLRTTAGHAISDPVYSFTKAEVTVEIKFYLESVDTDCATLWSYNSEQTFSLLICDSYVNTYYNNQKLEIKALNKIKAQTWYHLCTVWNDGDRKLEFFLVYFDSSGSKSYELASDTLEQSPLIPGGKFMIGQMYYDTSMDLEVMGWSLDGYFDEFTIWKRTVDLEFVILNAFAYKDGSEEGLSNLWRFNEGYGSVSRDSSSLQLKMEWVNGPRSHPEWAVCGYTMEYPVLSHHILSSILTTYSESDAETLCYNVLEKTGLRETMTEAGWLKFGQQCLFNIYSYGDPAMALEVVLAVADAYMVKEGDSDSDIRAISNWPGRTLCQDFKGRYFHGWAGDSCNIFCLSGDYNNVTNECVCSAGFWNTSCNQICPYARNSPCGGGTCNDGICTCTLDRYDASTGCKECSDGWTGADCSSASADVSNAVKRMGTSFALGHSVMFDGQGYDIHTPGQYILMETSDVGLYVRMKPRGSNVCIQQLWVQVGDQQFTIQTPLLDNEQLLFWHNLSSVDVVDSYTVTGSVSVSWEDQTTLKIDLTSFDNLIVKVTYLGSYLDVQVVFESSGCPGGVSGLLGNCDKNSDNDFYSSNSDTVAYHEVTQDIIDTYFAGKFLKSTTTGFVYSYPDLNIVEPVNMDSGYSLFFNQWGIMSSPVPTAVFDSTKNTTIDIKVKIMSDNGLIVGYNSDSKFSVFVENLDLKLWAFGNKYDANFTFVKDQWCHIFISHDITSDKIIVTVFIDSQLSHQYNLTISNVVFQSGGYFSLGYWQIKPPTNFGKLIGMIGTLRIWDKVLDDYVMFDASITKIVAGYENLGILFDFNEGVGLTATDSVNGVSMGLPRTGEVAWFITDLPQVPTASEECRSESTTVYSVSLNRDKCIEMLKSQALRSSCDDLGDDFVSSYFYDACLTDDSYISSLKAYVDVCTTVISPSDSPVADICTDGTDDHYQIVCAEFCKFGTPSESGCTCNSGYWGERCDGVCPGGSDNPCSGHGICDVTTGICECFQGFSNQDNCTMCDAMYIEPTCEMRYPPNYNSTANSVDNTKETVMKYCFVSSVGMVINFMEVAYDFKQIGQYYLVKPDSTNDKVPDIQVSFASCFTGRACITSVYLKLKAESVKVQGAASSAGNIVIKINETKEYTSTAQTGLQDITIEHTKGADYWLRSPDGALEVLITHGSTDARYLQVSVFMNDSNSCLDQQSICGSCENFTVGIPLAVYNESWVVPADNSTGGIADNSTGGASNATDGTDGAGGTNNGTDGTGGTNSTGDSTNGTDGNGGTGSGDGTGTGDSGDTSGSEDTGGTSGTGGSGGFGIKFVDTTPAIDDSDSGGSNSDGSDSGGSGSGGSDSDTTQKESVVSTDILKDVITNDSGLTISFKIKAENDTGTIFTYSQETVFDTYLEDGILKFAVGNDIFDSGITVPTDEWEHISLVWSDVTQQMIVYATPMANDTETQNYLFTVPEEAFNNYGTLTVGSFNPPFDPSVVDPIEQDFIGELDEFFVLDTALEASEESQFRNDSVPLDDDSLKLYYNFDSVDNYVIPDLVNDNSLNVDTPAWREPAVSFVPSDLPITPVNPDDLSSVAVDSIDALTAAKEECDLYFDNTGLISLCDEIINIDMYKDSCITIMEATGDSIRALESALQYAEACDFMLNIGKNISVNNQTVTGNNSSVIGNSSSDGQYNTSQNGNGTIIDSPLQFLCGVDPVATGYVGTNCDIPCKFPDPNGDGLTCTCAAGYWGTECDKLCPGGTENPCSGNGICNQSSGNCTCTSNHQGVSCSECAGDWLGKECQVVVQEKVHGSVSNFYSCSLTSDKHLATFDGAYLSLDTEEDGTFTMYMDSTLKIDIQIGPCSMYSKCVLAIAFAAGGKIASVVPQNTGVVKLNGEQLVIENYLALSSQYRLKNPSTGDFFLKGPNSFSVDVSVQPGFLNIFITSTSCPDARDATGICSGCANQNADSCASDDMLCMINSVGIAETISINSTVESSVLVNYFQQFHTDYQGSLFAAANESQITSGYGVKLETEKSYISFPPFGDDVFSHSNDTNIESDGKSIEIRTKFETADGGTVFSYATVNKTFGVVVEDGKFVVQHGTDTFPVGVDVAVGEWSNVGLSYDDQTGEVLFDYIYGDSDVHSYAIIDSVGTGALDVGGTLTIGQWNGITTDIPSLPPDGNSAMLVDRVLVWDKQQSPNDFENNWEVNKISREDGLSSIYNFDEGSGFESKDTLTDNIATIDKDSSWIQSNVSIVPESAKVDGTSTLIVKDATAEKICGDLKNVLMDQCSDLTSLLDNMYKTCFDDVAKTGNADDSMDSALLASKICSEQLNIEEPLKSSCNDFPSRNFPQWVGDVCDTQCLHGTFSAEYGCECDSGYYGGTCSEPCPGGPIPPCSGHGTCTSEGTCNCEPEWSGDSICSSCADNYSPPNCDELKVVPDDSCERTKCSLNKGGKLTRMDCTKKAHDATGNIVLISYGTLQVVVSIFISV